jgi:hypothetical protein
MAEYGFIANPDISIQQNVMQRLSTMSPQAYLNRVANLACHNLCKSTYISPAVIKLLGLGLKFCLVDSPPPPTLTDSFKRFRRDIRIRYHALFRSDNESGCDHYNPKLYVKLKNWNPDKADPAIEAAIANFGKSIQQEVVANRTRFRPNLLRNELHLLQQVRQNLDLVILNTDKNLGPAIWEREEYIKQTLKEHLLDNSKYKQLSKTEALTKHKKLKDKIAHLYRSF